MGTIKIGSSANRKGITVNPSVVLFNGKNVKSIMSGLTEIWSDIKALIPPMTSATTPSGEVVANGGITTGYEPYQAFNNGAGIWADFSQGQGSKTTWIYYKFDSPKKVRGFDVRFTVTTIFKFQASNDGSNFTDLTQNLSVAQNTINHYDINNDKKYLYYRIYVMSQSYSSAFYPGQLDEVQMYGS